MNILCKMLWIQVVLLLKLSMLRVQAQNGFHEEYAKLAGECLNNPLNRFARNYSDVNEIDELALMFLPSLLLKRKLIINSLCLEKRTCDVDFVGSCWPETLADKIVVLPCPSIFFDPLIGNISRKCNVSGSWEKPNISFCKKHSTPLQNDEEDMKQRVYVILSWLSIAVMIPSLVVSIYLLKGKNERFNVHTNLILAFTFRITTFFIHHYGGLGFSESTRVSCNFVWILNRYFASAEIMWMLNEALLLLRKVVIIFEKKSDFKYYLLVGWGSPLVFLTVYIPVMVYIVDLPPVKCWTYYKDSIYMLVLYVPLIIFLVVDLIALIYTVSIFVKTQKLRQKGDFVKIRKAIKGTLVLSPLLGVIYLLIFFVPQNTPVWYQYFLRIAYPMQGTLACLVYITFSSEFINRAKLKYQASTRGTRILENGSSWSFSHSRSRYTDRSIRGKPVPPSPDPSLDPSGLSHSSPSCENGSKCGCPDAIIARRTGLTGDDEQEECSF